MNMLICDFGPYGQGKVQNHRSAQIDVNVQVVAVAAQNLLTLRAQFNFGGERHKSVLNNGL